MTKNNICNTCLESDCSFCSTCSNHEANAPVFKETNNKKSQIEWASFNSCSKWVHPLCSGLTFKKIQKTGPISVSLFFSISVSSAALRTAKFAGIFTSKSSNL